MKFFYDLENEVVYNLDYLQNIEINTIEKTVTLLFENHKSSKDSGIFVIQCGEYSVEDAFDRIIDNLNKSHRTMIYSDALLT